MNTPVGALLVTLALIAPAAQQALGGDDRERIWILPFTPLQDDADLEYLQDALPALLAVAVSGSASHSIVERDALNLVLSEQSLTLAGLSSPEAQQRVGRLLGATLLVTGSFVRRGPQLHVMVRASSLETGVVVATAEGRRELDQPAELISALYGRLASELGRRLPWPAPYPIDVAPFSNLHFMKGLGHYYGARYSQSIAEFLLAGEDRQLADLSRLWLAKTYLAGRQYSHACLELIRLTNDAPTTLEGRDLVAGMRECERHVDREGLKMIRELAGRRDRVLK
jgi:TolB-like protein